MGEIERNAPRDGRGGIPDPVRACYDWSITAPSIAIIETIASVEGVDPVALAAGGGSTLHEYVDPELLDKLVTNGRENRVSISVTIDGYTVRIEGTELIVEPIQNDPSESE